MYRRAISTLGCGELSWSEAGDLARRHQLDGLELRSLGGSLDLPAALAAALGSPAALCKRNATLPVPVVTMGTSFSLVGAREADRASLLSFVPWAEALGCRFLRAFDGGRKGYDAAEVAEALATLAWWRAQRATRGWKVELLVETHDSLLTGDAISRFARTGRVGVLWDAHHTWRKGGEDPMATWAMISPYVGHIHVKDSRAIPGEARGYQYVLPGSGGFPMRALQPVLAREFTSCVSLEWERWWHPELPGLEEALAAARDCGWW